MSQSERVLLTGGNGLVGSAVLVALCEAGYTVHAVVRRQDAIDKTSAHPLIKRFSEKIQWSIVPDISKPDAFLEAVKGCHHIVHVASPIPPVPPRPMDMRTPALDGTQAILNAAESEPLVKRVVITGSVASLKKPEHSQFDHPDYQNGLPFMSGDKYYPVPTERPNDAAAPVFHRYDDSKIASGNLVRDYAAAHRDSHFELVLLCPGWVLGPGLFTTNKTEAMSTANTTLAWVMVDLREVINPALGVPADQPTPFRCEFVWVDDVALGHVRALTVPLPSKTNLEVWVMAVDAPAGPRLEDAEEILKRRSPELAKHLSFAGKVKGVPVNHDGARTQEELLGRSYVPFEEQVMGAVEWLLSLPDGEPLPV
ncbi:putative cinnamyl-alcohol dehydrogenase [Diaporthe ampelina]|uniref:Putative cinnamyl-alcohol dehydrogenase n=1 Tax=Diaporthe ampelina TaxID=1214573 RepID=A0A0G2F5Y2_9PEZI|nr:putative cinnamyl-alcohol dehydrogenase [Diaporthe ampelina]